MLAGSQRLNQMKWEIDATIRMALGFLTKAEVSRFRYRETICEFSTPGLKWTITKLKRECVSIEADDAENPIAGFAYTSTWGTDQVQMKHIRIIHRALPEVLTNLVKVFPSLNRLFALLLRAAPK